MHEIAVHDKILLAKEWKRSDNPFRVVSGRNPRTVNSIIKSHKLEAKNDCS